MNRNYSDLILPHRILLGPGPSDTDPRVLKAMVTPIVGQFDPAFTKVMEETMELLRYAFQTDNRWSFPVSGTGRSGLEALLINIIEPGDRVLVPIVGKFGHLTAEIATRCGADVHKLEGEWGQIADPNEVRGAFQERGPFKVLAAVHGETSTGILQPMEELANLAHENGALFVVDAVATLGGAEVKVDEWGIDACVAGSQKCLSCPSGLAPVTYNDAFEAVVRARSKPPTSFYFDLLLLQDYWDRDKRYNHHTAPAAMIAGLREALRALYEETIEGRVRRTKMNETALSLGLEALGLERLGPSDPEHRMPMLTPVRIPKGADDVRVRQTLLERFGIEIGAAFGPLQGRVWRIGTTDFDLLLLQDYWDRDKRYNHHTAPAAMIAGLREALRALYEETIEGRVRRTKMNETALSLGLEALGLERLGPSDPEHRMPMLTPIRVPEGADDVRVRQTLLERFGIEIGAAFGPLQGKVWRIGTMGYSSQPKNVLLLLAALEALLHDGGLSVTPGAGVTSLNFAREICSDYADFLDGEGIDNFE